MLDVCPACKARHEPGATCAGFGPKQRRPPVEPGAADPTSAEPTEDGGALIVEMALVHRAPGTMLGSFRLLERIGEGGMGTVYRAHDTALDRPVVVKLISARELLGNNTATKRFLAEARFTARIRHPNVVQVHGLGTDPDGNPYLVMELLEGTDLDHALKAGEAFPLARIVHIGTQMLSGLAAAHEHLVHRDLKPANVYLAHHGETKNFVKLLDFGIAKALSDATAS